MECGNWKEHFGLDVHHRTIGIIGMGRIGEAVAKRAKFGFDMDVLYYNRRRKKKLNKNSMLHIVIYRRF